MDWLQMYLRCQNVGIWVKSVDLPVEEPDYIYKEGIILHFDRFIQHLTQIITKGQKIVKPIGMSDENFLKAKPIIEKLVAAGDLNDDWLALYN